MSLRLAAGVCEAEGANDRLVDPGIDALRLAGGGDRNGPVKLGCHPQEQLSGVALAGLSAVLPAAGIKGIVEIDFFREHPWDVIYYGRAD